MRLSGGTVRCGAGGAAAGADQLEARCDARAASAATANQANAAHNGFEAINLKIRINLKNKTVILE